MRFFTAGLVSLLLSAWSISAQAQSEVTIQTVPVAEHVHMLVGRGGNIAVVSGPGGVLLVDDQFAP